MATLEAPDSDSEGSMLSSDESVHEVEGVLGGAGAQVDNAGDGEAGGISFAPPVSVFAPSVPPPSHGEGGPEGHGSEGASIEMMAKTYSQYKLPGGPISAYERTTGEQYRNKDWRADYDSDDEEGVRVRNLWACCPHCHCFTLGHVDVHSNSVCTCDPDPPSLALLLIVLELVLLGVAVGLATHQNVFEFMAYLVAVPALVGIWAGLTVMVGRLLARARRLCVLAALMGTFFSLLSAIVLASLYKEQLAETSTENYAAAEIALLVGLSGLMVGFRFYAVWIFGKFEHLDAANAFFVRWA